MPRPNWKRATPPVATEPQPATATATLPQQSTDEPAIAPGRNQDEPGNAASPAYARAQAAIGETDLLTAARSEFADILEPEWLLPYLAALAQVALKKHAARMAGISYRSVCRYRETHGDLGAREEAAMRSALINVVEPEIIRRAVRGVRRVRYGRDGKILSVEREYSDQMALRLAERLETGSWRQKQQIEHSGGMTFKSEAERKAALEKARAIRDGKPEPVEALNGRS